MKKEVKTTVFATPKLEKATRVAAYARVSSGKDAMLHSLSAQVSYYSSLIQKHGGWVYCGVYSDEARSGTKADRPGFQKMLNDCRAGKIDLIITKSVTRFSRNVVTFLETVRELRSLGVDVFFEEQNIHTASGDGELLLTILAGFAQAEAESVSENQKWRIKKNFEEGRPWNCTMLGYRSSNGVLEVVPEEAAVVKRIFDLYLSGHGMPAIVKILNGEGIRTRHGKAFSCHGVSRILNNYAYTGSLLLQKTYSENGLTKKRMENGGELPMYHAENTHEAIIDKAVFEAVSEIIARQKAKHAPAEDGPHKYLFSGKITCAKCGNRYKRKITHGGPVWICRTFNDAGKAFCNSRQIPEPSLEAAAAGLQFTKITADDGNLLTFLLADGSTVQRTWKERSRSQAWTEEMRKNAAEREKARLRKCRNEK